MREGQFISKNKNRWESYSAPSNDPDELAKRFTYLIDDLGYAKTHYPKSNTVKYINSMASGIYLSIYKNKKEKSNRLVEFFKTEVPLIAFKHRKILLYSFLFFTVFMAIGVFAAWKHPEFISSILGDGYVEMTESNIKNGKPFGVYGMEDSFIMFIRIAFNNIRVALYCFSMGIFLSVGTLYILISNGLMVGVFEQMFIQHGLGTKWVLVVMIHGTLELSSIVIAGAAGMIMGNSILFPGTYSRKTSFMRGAKDGLKILISTIPILAVAAFFESYITRHENMPIVYSIIILSSSALFIVWYFFIYPRIVNRKLQAQIITMN